MPLSFDKIISEVKTLILRLKSSDELTSQIITETKYYHGKLQNINQIQEKILNLVEKCTVNSDSYSNGDIAFNSHSEQLRIENDELQELLRDYQTALELIMSKYREEVSEYMQIGQNGEGASGNINNLRDCDKNILQLNNQPEEIDSSSKIEKELEKKYAFLIAVAREVDRSTEDRLVELEGNIKELGRSNEAMRLRLGLALQSSADGSGTFAGIDSDDGGSSNLGGDDEDCPSDTSSVRTLV